MIKKRITYKQYEYTGGCIDGIKLKKLGKLGWQLIYWNDGSGILSRELQRKKLKL